MQNTLNVMVSDYFERGGTVTVVRPQRKLPKNLRYSPFTANAKNDAPVCNPLRDAWRRSQFKD